MPAPVTLGTVKAFAWIARLVFESFSSLQYSNHGCYHLKGIPYLSGCWLVFIYFFWISSSEGHMCARKFQIKTWFCQYKTKLFPLTSAVKSLQYQLTGVAMTLFGLGYQILSLKLDFAHLWRYRLWNQQRGQRSFFPPSNVGRIMSAANNLLLPWQPSRR